MTDLIDQLHADAGLNLLRADSGLTVYDGAVPNPWPGLPFVLVYVVVEWPARGEGISLDSLSVKCQVSWYCHSVGETAIASRAVAQRVRAALLNQRPTVSGRVCGLINQESADPPRRDESIGTVVMNAVSVYSLVTMPG